VTELASTRIRETIFSVLAQRGQPAVAEDEPLFSTGRLDSLAATEVLTMLESDFGIDLADEDFDILQIDTLRDIEALLSTRKAA
jgi:acyl carrier protein